MQALAVHRLENLTSKAACSAAVQSSQSDISIEITIFTANTRYFSQRQVSMLRQMIDEASAADTSSEPQQTKKWVLLLHFLPGAALKDSYPALFLYGWNFWYLDSCTGGVSQQEMLHMPSWAAAAAAALHGQPVAPQQLLGEAETYYGSSIKPYVLAHVRPSAAASQAAAQAKPNVPAALRSIADFYNSQDAKRRQTALDDLLVPLQGMFQQQYGALWGSDSISVLMVKAAKSVADGYHRNLSTALADLYQSHIGSFLAEILDGLCGNNLDLITLMDAQQEWTRSRPGNTSLLQAFVTLCETRTAAELSFVMNQVNVISVLGDRDYSNFRPKHDFPLFARVSGMLTNIKDESMLSLEAGERSCPEVVASAVEASITQNAGLAALQDCLAVDGDLRLRYMQAIACNRLGVPFTWLAQRHSFISIVEDWLTALSPDFSLATFHVELSFHESQLAAGVMLLKQMDGLGQQPRLQLPPTLEKQQVSTFIIQSLWAGLQSAVQHEPLHMSSLDPLRQAAQHILSCSQTASSKRFVLLAVHKLMQRASSDSTQHLHHVLQELFALGNQQQQASNTFTDVLQLLAQSSIPDAAAQAVQSLAVDLFQRVAKAQGLQPSLIQELQAALHVLFHSNLPIGRHSQEHLLMQLLSAQTLQLTNRAKRADVRHALQAVVEQAAAEQLPVVLKVLGAELTYVPELYGGLRAQASEASQSPFADALYTAQLRLLMAATTPAGGNDQDLPSLLADLRLRQPSRTSPISQQLMDSITYCAHLHSLIAWLASEFSTAEAQQHLQHALLHSDAAGRSQGQLQSIFREATHQRLFVSHLQRHSAAALSDVLDSPISRVGLGAWTQQWADAMKLAEGQQPAHQPPRCNSEAYVALQKQFQQTVVAHASDQPGQASEAATASAELWLVAVECKAAGADDATKRKLKADVVLMTYYGLFDCHRYSPDLAGVCPRLAFALSMTPQEGFILHFLANLSSSDLQHVHADTDMARLFKRDTEDLPAEDRMQRHFLINLMASIMQQPPDHSILYTHLFSPGSIHGTWPLGSSYNHVVGNVHYDCGVQFTENHVLANAQPPLQDPPSAHFVTLLSWGAISLAHMFFPAVHGAIYGPVMSHRAIDDRIAAPSDHAWLSIFMHMRVESCWRGLQIKAGLSGDMRMLVLNQALQGLVDSPAVGAADQQTFGSRQESSAFEVALCGLFYLAYNRREEMQAQLEALQNASQLRQDFQQWDKALPWTLHVPDSSMAHAHQPTIVDMLSLFLASDSQRSQSYGLLSAFLARRANWTALQLLRPALHIYNWVQTALRGLVTLEDTLNNSVYDYLRAYKQKDFAQGARLEQMWDNMQRLWNQFHTARGGFVADDCQPNSAFGQLSNETCLATLIGVNSEDNELVKVLKALMAMQNDFLEKAEQHGLPHSPDSMPVHLLTHSSMEQHLLVSNPFQFDSYVYSQAASDTAPMHFDLHQLTQQVAEVIASKRFIKNTLPSMHKDFCYKQSAVQRSYDMHTAQPASQLPAAFAVPFSPEQLNALKTHCSHVHLEELQQVSGALATLGQIVQQQDLADGSQGFLPSDLITDAVAATAGERPPDTSSAVQHRPLSSFFSKHGILELRLAHLKPVSDFVHEQHQQQGYQFADISPVLKAPMSAEQAIRLRLQLSQGCKQEAHNRQALTELVAALREAELNTLPSQANRSASIRSVCEAWAYEADEFPVSALDQQLMCSQYVAAMSVMLQVLREAHTTASAEPKVWSEADHDMPPPAMQLASLRSLRLPIWTDAVTQTAHEQSHPDPSLAVHATTPAVSLPQTISWQRIPEPMVVKSIRLVCSKPTAAELHQGMQCGLSICVMSSNLAPAGEEQQVQPAVQLNPQDFAVHSPDTLAAELKLPVEVDQCISITTVGAQCGPGDVQYLASWGDKQRGCQNFTDEAEAAYILSHGHASEGDNCMVQVLLCHADPEDEHPISPSKAEHHTEMDWLPGSAFHQGTHPALSSMLQSLVEQGALHGTDSGLSPMMQSPVRPDAIQGTDLDLSPMVQSLEQQGAMHGTDLGPSPMVQSPVQQGATKGADTSSSPLVQSPVHRGTVQNAVLLEPGSPVQQTASPTFAATQQQPDPQMETLSTLAGASFLAEPSDRNLDIILQKLGFASKADAVAWLAGDGFTKAGKALADLGANCGSEVVLLQAQQVEQLSAIRLFTRRKMVGVLSEVVTDADQLRTVFEQHQAWLEENLDMTCTGDVKLVNQQEMEEQLRNSPLTHLARRVLINQALKP